MKAYQMSQQEVLKELGGNEGGLTLEQVKVHQEKYGINEITGEKQDGPLVTFFKQFKDLLVIILIVAGIVSAVSGELESTAVIFVVITVNAILGTVQTIKAQKSLESLQALSSPRAKVIRQGTMVEVDAKEVTVGDIVQIEAGDVIVADGRLIHTSSLQVNESALTGESNSVDKNTDILTEDVVIGDQINMVFSGGLVTNGTARYIVTAVAMETEIGKIATLLNDTKEKKTPLQKSLDDFSVKLSIGIIIISLVVLALNVFISHVPVLDAVMIAVALAVAAIPEALSSIVTIVLSISTQKMVKENAIIKNLNAVESLGCVSIICSDKTGTLTQNKMTAIDIYNEHKLLKLENLDHTDREDGTLLKACVICNNAIITDNQRIGDPTEIALLDLYYRYNKNVHYEITTMRKLELPFDSTRKLMSVASENHIYTKGAPDELVKRCTKILINQELIDITEEDVDKILKQNEAFANQGLRVLAFGYKQFKSSSIDFKDESDLIFVGMVSLMDPPRLESQEAVSKCKIAGIKPIMITGDHVVTARSIAKTIGIYKDGDICMEGKELETMDEKQLQEILPQISVYARVAPEHKIRIVKAWQARGEIVAMTGDGVNDAPALKHSDIGVAMGITGSEVSKDAASMILTDDNFSTIVKAIITGRNVYTNIKNSITYLLSGNFSAILCVLLTSLLALPSPFHAVQLLFINLVTDSLPAIAIGMEQGNDSILKQKPRGSKDSILNKETVRKITFEGVVIFGFTIASYFVGLQTSAELASTMAFVTLCLARLLHGFNCRSYMPIFKLSVNMYSIYAFIVGFLLVNLIILTPSFHALFDVESLSVLNYVSILWFALAPSIVIQTAKTLKYWKEKSNS